MPSIWKLPSWRRWAKETLFETVIKALGMMGAILMVGTGLLVALFTTIWIVGLLMMVVGAVLFGTVGTMPDTEPPTADELRADWVALYGDDDTDDEPSRDRSAARRNRRRKKRRARKRG